MRIGIIGPGNVGSTLGRRLAGRGHTVAYGVREADSAKTRDLLAAHPGTAKAVPLEGLAGESDLVFLTVPYPATEDALAQVGSLEGKILVDATNPLLPGLAGLAVGTTDSQGERVARLAPGARVVKAFNTIGFQVMADPILGGRAAVLMVVGDDAHAKNTVIDLATSLGFEAVDFGPLKNARYTEPLAMVWIFLAHLAGWGPGFALSLARR